MNYLPIFLETR